jgi:alpha-glucosidase
METPGWWCGAVIYQIYPRSFLDVNGDGVGDLRGIEVKLDYVASLGVDAIWISPFFLSPMADFGYDIADYCAVDPLFGTLADFDRLLAKAHALGLKVMIDQVLSHSSNKHAWFKESRASRDNPKADWYVWADAKPDGSPPNNWLSIFGGGAWQWEPRRGQYYLHNFLVSQPDLNFHNPDVQQASLDNVKFWLDRGVDGLRLDAINFCFHDRLLRDNPAKPPHLRTGRGFSPDNPYAFQYRPSWNACARCWTSTRTWARWARFPPKTCWAPWPTTRGRGGCTWPTASSCSPRTVRRASYAAPWKNSRRT